MPRLHVRLRRCAPVTAPRPHGIVGEGEADDLVAVGEQDVEQVQALALVHTTQRLEPVEIDCVRSLVVDHWRSFERQGVAERQVEARPRHPGGEEHRLRRRVAEDGGDDPRRVEQHQRVAFERDALEAFAQFQGVDDVGHDDGLERVGQEDPGRGGGRLRWGTLEEGRGSR